jgi:hypothetical protein
MFGVFLLWIAATGVLSQIGELVNNGGFADEAKERGARQAAAVGAAVVPGASAHEDEERGKQEQVKAAQPAVFVCPAEMTCRPKRQPRAGEWNVGALHHLHSGETFGPLGVVISLLSGLSLLFFAFSGLWMYIRMWSHRRGNDHKPAWFWK